MFDVIVNNAPKYVPNAEKLEAKADWCLEKRDVIAIVQITTERGAVKTRRELNVPRRIHVRHRLKRRMLQAKHVGLLPRSS
jgi:hypothetical protein